MTNQMLHDICMNNSSICFKANRVKDQDIGEMIVYKQKFKEQQQRGRHYSDRSNLPWFLILRNRRASTGTSAISHPSGEVGVAWARDWRPKCERDAAPWLVVLIDDVVTVAAYAHLLWRSGLTGIIVQPTSVPLRRSCPSKPIPNQNTQLYGSVVVL